MGIYSDKFCKKDSVLDGFDFEELIDTITVNEPEINEKTVKKIFDELIKSQFENAREVLKANMSNILNELKG